MKSVKRRRRSRPSSPDVAVHAPPAAVLHEDALQHQADDRDAAFVVSEEDYKRIIANEAEAYVSLVVLAVNKAMPDVTVEEWDRMIGDSAEPVCRAMLVWGFAESRPPAMIADHLMDFIGL